MARGWQNVMPGPVNKIGHVPNWTSASVLFSQDYDYCMDGFVFDLNKSINNKNNPDTDTYREQSLQESQRLASEKGSLPFRCKIKCRVTSPHQKNRCFKDVQD